jgi:hypothetical protein
MDIEEVVVEENSKFCFLGEMQASLCFQNGSLNWSQLVQSGSLQELEIR